MTQEKFAERIDVSPQYISDLERGVVGPSITTIKNACMALGVSSDYLIFGDASAVRQAALRTVCNDLNEQQFTYFRHLDTL